MRSIGKMKEGRVGERKERRKGGKGKGARKCGDQKETGRRTCAAWSRFQKRKRTTISCISIQRYHPSDQ